jgi:uncharacterized protein YjgD (DUF1641 family)
MVTDIEEVKKIIKEKNLKTGEETYETMQDIARESPFLEKNSKIIAKMRGKVMEASTHIEEVFNQIILNVPKTDMLGNMISSYILFHNPPQNDLSNLCNPKPFIKKQYEKSLAMVTDTFMKKSGYVKNIMRIHDTTGVYFNKDFIKKYSQLVFIRNRFAHVPFNMLSKNLEFSKEAHYDRYFMNATSRDIKTNYNEFGRLYTEILNGLRAFLSTLIDKWSGKGSPYIDLGFEK